MNGRLSTRDEIRSLALRGKGLFTFQPQTRLAHFTALNESNFKSFTQNAYKRSRQCAIEDAARQCVMEIWPHFKFGFLSSKLLNQNVLQLFDMNNNRATLRNQ